MLQRLELHRLGCDVRHIDAREHLFRRAGIIVGGSADQREAGERHHGVDAGAAVLHQEGLDRRTGIKAARENRNDLQPLRLEGGDHAVVMRRVACENVGAQHQETDPARCLPKGARQVRDLFADARGEPGMIDADFRIGDRIGDLETSTEALARTIGEFVDQQPHEVRDVAFRTGQPILQGQEIDAQILRRAGNEAKQLRQPSQHRHLAGARALGRAGLLIRLAAQPLEEGQCAAALLAHA